MRDGLEPRSFHDEGRRRRTEQKVEPLRDPPADEIRPDPSRDDGREHDVAGPGRIDDPIGSERRIPRSPVSVTRLDLVRDPTVIPSGEEERAPGSGQSAERGHARRRVDVVAAQPKDVRAGDERTRGWRDPCDRPPRLDRPEQPLPPEPDDGCRGRHVRPSGRQLPGDRHEEPPGRVRHPWRGRRRGELIRTGMRDLEAALRALDVLEDRAVREPDGEDIDPARPELGEFGRGRRLVVHADDGGRAQTEPGGRQRAEDHATPEAPATRIVPCEIARRRTDDDDVRNAPAGRRVGAGHVRILGHADTRPPPEPEAVVFFYELHEGDDEVYSDVLLYSDSEWEPDEFFQVVQAARRRIQDTYTQDTLIEAIAMELEREHGFLYIADDRLTAAVNVSTVDEENFLATVDADLDDEDEDDDDDGDPERADYVTIRADLDRDWDRRVN
jgi:hypothetical protein